MTATLTFNQGSIEYVAASVTSDVTLDAQTVTMSVDSGATWVAAEWVGDVGTTRQVRTSSPVTFATVIRREVYVLVKIVDTPEIPVVTAGSYTVRSA
jgi:hypothetical protein